MEASDEFPPLSACVRTLPEAVRLSINDGWTIDSPFIFARALKAFEITTGARLAESDLEAAFALLWSTAKPHLPPDADFDEYRFDFLDRFAKTRAPLGSNPLQEAIRHARAATPPPEASRYPRFRGTDLGDAKGLIRQLNDIHNRWWVDYRSMRKTQSKLGIPKWDEPPMLFPVNGVPMWRPNESMLAQYEKAAGL